VHDGDQCTLDAGHHEYKHKMAHWHIAALRAVGIIVIVFIVHRIGNDVCRVLNYACCRVACDPARTLLCCASYEPPALLPATPRHTLTVM
jgi:hypothetical protein